MGVSQSNSMASTTDSKTLLQNYINAFLTDDSNNERMRERKKLKPGQRIAPRWNPFDSRQQALVTVLDRNYKVVANARYRALTGKQTIELPVANNIAIDCIFKVIDAAQDDLDKLTEYDNDLVRQALTVFINNHIFATSLGLKTPSLTKSAPHIMLPGHSLPLNAPESRMDWWREDPGVNEHHNHWHAIYVTNGIADPKYPNPNFAYTKDRQGELFAWMHKQMLARYDAERVAVGLDPVIALSNYYDPIPEGYLPNKYLTDYNANTDETVLTGKFDYRLPYSRIDQTMKSIVAPANAPPLIQQVDTWVASVRKSIDDGVFFNDPNKLGNTIDPDRTDPDKLEDDEWKAKYGRIHASGHNMVASIVGNKEVYDALKAKNIQRVPQGVMGNLATACRDPVFYRWHRFVDELFNSCSNKSTPRVFSDIPNVSIKACDILLAFKDQLVKADPAGEKDRWREYGAKNFGKSGFPSTNELQTTMKKRVVQGLPNEEKFEIEYLLPREFYYFFKVKNNYKVDKYEEGTGKIVQVPAEKFVTLRVFIVPDILSHDRKQWIELDKFKYTLKAGEETIISRACELSSVIRKPAQKEFPGTSTDNFDSDYCGCGWPYNLLLPRGTKEGMKFRLFVFISDWNADKTPDSTVEGSLSMCGKTIDNDGKWAKYPDSRDMGYPFDRPYAGNSLLSTFSKQAADITTATTASFPPTASSGIPEDYWLENIAMRDVTIRLVNDFC